MRNESLLERVYVSGPDGSSVGLESHDVVPWHWPDSGTHQKPPARLFVVSGESLEWVLKQSRGEAMVTFVVRLLSSQCKSSSRGDIMIDIGANEGYYGLLSASLGCRVLAFEPQPGCRAKIDAAIAFNRFAHSMRVVGQPVAPAPSKTLWLPSRGCRMMGIPTDMRGSQVQRSRFTSVHTVTLDEGIGGKGAQVIGALSNARISLVKVDTEGAELSVLQSMLVPTLGRIDNIVVETSPGWWTERFNQSRAEGAVLYASLLSEHGFALAYTSGGRWIRSSRHMHAYIMGFGKSGYWSQEDIWLGRDAQLMVRAVQARYNASPARGTHELGLLYRHVPGSTT